MFTALNSVAWSAFNLSFNLYIHSLGYQQDFIGLLNGVPSVVILIVGLPIGVLADRYGYLRFLVAGSVLTAVTGFGLGLSSGQAALLTFAILGGLGASLSWVIGAPMMMAISTKEERVFLFSVQSALMMGAGFIGSLMAGFVPEVAARYMGLISTDTTPLRITYLIGASFNLLAVIPILRMTQVKGNGASGTQAGGAGGPPANDGASASAGSGAGPGLLALLRRSLGALPAFTRRDAGLFAKLLLPSALISFGAGAMVVFFQLFFNMRFDLKPGVIGVIFAFSSVVTALATLISPILAARLGKVRTVVYTQLASIPFLLLLAYSYNLPAVIVAYYCRNALMNMAGPLQTTFGLEQVKEGHRATLTSLQAMLGNLGRGGLGPIASGYIQVSSGFGMAFTMTSICYVIGSLLYYGFFRRFEPAPAFWGRLRAGRGTGAGLRGGGPGQPGAVAG